MESRDPDVKALHRLTSLAQQEPDKARLLYGAGYAAALPLLAGPGGEWGEVWFSDAVTLLLNDAGQIRGFETIEATGEVIRVDYSDPRSLQSTERPVLVAPAGYSLGAIVPRAVEERLVRGLATVNPRYVAAAEAARVKPRLPMAAASRLATAIVTAALATVAGNDRAPHVAVLRAMPPMLRRRLTWLLDTGRDHLAAQQLLCAAPVLALWPDVLRRNAGVGLKTILKKIGLPKSAASITPAGVGAMATFARAVGAEDDEIAGLFEWMTADVCGALPAEGWRQKAVIEVVSGLSLTGRKQVELVGWARWLEWVVCHVRKLDAADRASLGRWMRATKTVLGDLKVAPWRPNMTLVEGLAAARRFDELAPGCVVKGGRATFRQPRWAPDDARFGLWSFERLISPAELELEGRRMGNCVGTYAGEVSRGACAIYRLCRAAVFPGDDQRVTAMSRGLGEVGVVVATVEVVCHGGRARAVQVKGPKNSSVSSLVMEKLAGLKLV